MNKRDNELWGVVYGGKAAYAREAGQRLAVACGHILVVAPQALPYWQLAANILIPRQPGSLAAWLSVWQDTLAQSIIWLDGGQPAPEQRAIAALSASCGQQRALAADNAVYFSRACFGVGQRLYKQGQTELGALLQVLKVPSLTA